MSKEIKIAYRLFAILGTLIVILVLGAYVYLRLTAPHLFNFSKLIHEERVEITLDDLPGSVFLTGMNGCENIYLMPASLKFFVTDLGGYIHCIDGPAHDKLKIVKSLKLGRQAIGLCLRPDGWLYAGVTDFDKEGWQHTGAYIVKVDTLLEQMAVLSRPFPSMNGIAFDQAGNLFITSGNFNPLHPSGTVFIMHTAAGSHLDTVSAAIHDIGMANGLFFDQRSGMLYVSNTLECVYAFRVSKSDAMKVYQHTKFLELTDDLCVDREGNIWMTDPGHSTIKKYDPDEKSLTRFNIRGIGQTSSCRIRTENGKQILYITEINKKHSPMSGAFDGRGVFVIPLQELEKLCTFIIP